MHIVVFASYFHPHKGGMEKYVYEIYRRLAVKGVEVDIITCNTNNAPAEEIYEGMNIYRFDCWDALGKTYPIPKINKKFIKIIKKLNINSYSFVNTQTRFFIISLIGFIYGKIRGIKVIHTEHGTLHTFFSNPALDFLSKAYDHTIGFLITRFADYNIGISVASGEFSKHLGAKDYSIAYNGIDMEKFKKRDTDLKGRLGVPKDYKIITFIGRLIEAKGVQDLITAFKEVKNKAKVMLLIVGNGNYKDQLMELATGDKDILFLGGKNEEEIVDLLNITDIFVNPSYSEGLPTSVLEAAACGCRIIATDVGGTKEIKGEANQNSNSFFLYKAGKIVQLKNQLIFFLKEEGLAENQHMPFAPARSMNVFSWDVIAGKYCLFLNSI